MVGNGTWGWLSAGGSAAVLAMGLLAPEAPAQEASDCLACHADPGLTTERKGRTLSLHVSEKAYAASIHGSLACIDHPA